MLTSYFMRFALNEVVHGRYLKDCTFTVVFAQKHWGCATTLTKWIKIDSSNESLKVQIHDLSKAYFKLQLFF